MEATLGMLIMTLAGTPVMPAVVVLVVVANVVFVILPVLMLWVFRVRLALRLGAQSHCPIVGVIYRFTLAAISSALWLESWPGVSVRVRVARTDLSLSLGPRPRTPRTRTHRFGSRPGS